jgi:hypothetical protein
MGAALMPEPVGVPHLETVQIDVTPTIAKRWLEANSETNRPLSVSVAREYATEMVEGRWLLTHQGPAFDTSGKLIDGQHRLAAVVLAGVTVPMTVTYGADPETYTVLDIGRRRTPAHVIQGSNVTIKAAAARFLLDAEPGRLGYTTRLHNRDAVRVVEEHPVIEQAARLAREVYKNTRISQPMMCALLVRVLESKAAPLADEWCTGLATGSNLGPTDARLLLRNRWALDGSIFTGGGGRRIAALYLIVRAWNAWAGLEQLRKLQIPADVRVRDVPALHLAPPLLKRKPQEGVVGL